MTDVSYPFTSTIDASGRVIAVGLGSYRGAPTDTDFYITRFSADGSVDTSFATNGVALLNINPGQSRDGATDVIIDRNGNIVVAGTAGGGNILALTRLTSTGLLDTSFSGDGIATFTVNPNGSENVAKTIALDSSAASDRYVVGLQTYGRGMVVTRINNDGSLDTSFGNTGKAVVANSGDTWDVLVDSLGRIYAVGQDNNNNGLIVRFTSAGVLDTSFGTGGKIVLDLPNLAYASSIAFAADGNLLVSLYTNTNGSDNGDFYLYKFDLNGTAVTTFGTNGVVVTDLGGWGDYANAVAVDPATGRIAVTGPAAMMEDLSSIMLMDHSIPAAAHPR